MAARGIAGGEYALATSTMAARKHAVVRRGVPSPFFWNSRRGVLFCDQQSAFLQRYLLC